MKIVVPTDSDSLSSSQLTSSSDDVFHDTLYFPELMASSANDIEMTQPSSTMADLERLKKYNRFEEALSRAPLETQALFKNIMEGKDSQILRPTYEASRYASNDERAEKVMKKDAHFDKWDGEPHSWTPHYHFLKVQCRVYLPLLITEEAICMKIYQSIPEPQRQRIRGYWIECGRTNTFNHKEMLEECDRKFFDKIGAEKAEKKLQSMRQGEAQIFRSFLQEWELQLEFAGGCTWPESFKTSQLKQSISEKLSNKIDVLNLPRDDYQAWVDEVARVAANMESRANFFQKGEAQVTQDVNRDGIQRSVFQHDYVSAGVPSQSTMSHTDHDGDVLMGGMKLDLRSLANMIANMNLNDQSAAKSIGKPKQKPPAPWRTEKELEYFRQNKLCSRCKKPGHFYRYCKEFGPAKKPTHIGNVIDDIDALSGKE